MEMESSGEMRLPILLMILLNHITFLAGLESINDAGLQHYTNEWVVKISKENLAAEIGNKKGFTYVKQIEGFDDMHLFVKHSHPKTHTIPSHYLSEHLEQHEAVVWAEQQVAKIRERKGVLNRRETERSRYEEVFNDEYWKLQWYEHDYRAANTKSPTLDMRLVPVYREFNITGAGVRVCVIDDGLEYTHDDLKDNFDPETSYNLNNHTFDVLPRYEDPINSHGTRCAGEIAMKANNTKCGVGIAFNAKVGGIKLLDGVTTDLLEARAIQYALDKVDIYTGSWGPLDNGLVVDGPGRLASLAIENGINKGRKGKGALYFFAGGNGKINQDNCACDGYASSIYTITVASANELGRPSYYSERCSAIMVTTYSGGITGQVKVVTTDLHNGCTVAHTGTSAAAPLGAGIAALLLEANQQLTWRDVQHIIIDTAEVAPISNDREWSQNAAGLWYSLNFGFGLMNAYELVKRAFSWVMVPPKTVCKIPFYIIHSKREFSRDKEFVSSVRTDACGIRYVEHVQLYSTINHTQRGVVEIFVQSASGTVSQLLESRDRDTSALGFNQWTFMSLEFWGENPNGIWKGIVKDSSTGNKILKEGFVEEMSLIIHGTVEQPHHYKTGPRKYIHFEKSESIEENISVFKEHRLDKTRISDQAEIILDSSDGKPAESKDQTKEAQDSDPGTETTTQDKNNESQQTTGSDVAMIQQAPDGFCDESQKENPDPTTQETQDSNPKQDLNSIPETQNSIKIQDLDPNLNTQDSNPKQDLNLIQETQDSIKMQDLDSNLETQDSNPKQDLNLIQETQDSIKMQDLDSNLKTQDSNPKQDLNPIQETQDSIKIQDLDPNLKTQDSNQKQDLGPTQEIKDSGQTAHTQVSPVMELTQGIETQIEKGLKQIGLPDYFSRLKEFSFGRKK